MVQTAMALDFDGRAGDCGGGWVNYRFFSR